MSSSAEAEPEEQEPLAKYAPPEGGRLWRYMHLPKFIAMLSHGGLYHVRADLLGDPYEGRFTDGFLEAMAEADAVKGRGLDSSKFLAEGADMFRRLQFVSCWCMHEHELKSMWDRYAKDSGGVCVETTVGALRSCLPAGVHLGEVRYIDYASRDNAPFLYTYDYVLHKRRSFIDEREVRSFTVRETHDARGFLQPTGEHGVWVTVDLGQLVQRVWVGPGSEEWVYEMIQGLVTRYGYSFPVAKSELLNTPRGVEVR